MVRVKQKEGAGNKMIKIEEPSMAINDCRSEKLNRVQRYQMTYTWDVNSWDPKKAPMVQKEGGKFVAKYAAAIASGASFFDKDSKMQKFVGKLKNLVINCHGTPGQLKLGKYEIDSSDLRHFSVLKGLVEKIWLPSCNIAQSGDQRGGYADGISFCARLAKTVGCYVVAPTQIQCASFATIPRHYIEGFEGLLYSFGPSGEIIWSAAYPPAIFNDEGNCTSFGSWDYDTEKYK
jgi:hypothetical protein